MAVLTSDLTEVDIPDEEFADLGCDELFALVRADVIGPPESCRLTDPEAAGRQETRALQLALGGPHLDAPLARAQRFGMGARRRRPGGRGKAQEAFEAIHTEWIADLKRLGETPEA